MLFTDMKEEHDKIHAFDSFITIAEAKKLGVIPEKYHSYFPDLCECGSENIITIDLQQPQCCDPRCKIKQSYALAELLSRYDCVGLGPAKCMKIYEALSSKFQRNSYLECLTVPYDDYPLSVRGYAFAEDFYQACIKIQSTVVTFPELISKLGIPHLSGKAIDLLDGINSFAELKDKILKEGGLICFCANRGVRDKMLIFWLWQNLFEIALADSICGRCIRQSGLVKQVICITGKVVYKGQRMTKKEFVRFCNSMTVTEEGVQLMEICDSSGKQTATHIIADSTASTAKYVAGKARGIETDVDGVPRSVLMTSEEYVDTIKEICDKWKKNLQTSLKTSSMTLDQEMNLASESPSEMTCFQ